MTKRCVTRDSVPTHVHYPLLDVPDLLNVRCPTTDQSANVHKDCKEIHWLDVRRLNAEQTVNVNLSNHVLRDGVSTCVNCPMHVVSMLNVKLLVTRRNVLVQSTLLEIQLQNVHLTRMSVPQVHVVRMPSART